MKVLVTGATGFIGKEIVNELLSNSFEVIGVASPKSNGKKSVVESKIKIFTADITDTNSVSDLKKLGKIDVLIHSAGLAHQFGDTKKEEFDLVNVQGTRNVLDLAIRLRAEHFILIGSTAVYGIDIAKENNSDILKSVGETDENSETNPQTLYARSKLEAEEVCREVCQKSNLPLTIFRLAPVIGEANVGNVARLIRTVDKGRFLWIGKGENLKSLIYKTDVARACVELVKNKSGGTEIFNLSAPPVKMKSFVNEIALHLNKKIYGLSIPTYFLYSIFQINSKFIQNKKLDKIKDTIDKWLSDDVYSAAKIKEKYKFEPKTSVSEAIKKQIKFYKS